jgi:ferredoxin-type protein NapF
MVDASRRGFFRGRPRPKAEIRPPWALAESLFTDCCTRCNDCIDACPEQIIVIGDGGYPTIDFKRGECTFCADCVSACKPLALVRGEDQPGWTHKAVIADSCLPHRGVECRVCEDFCDARAIRFSPASVAARCRSLQRRNVPVVAPASPLARSTPFRSPFSQR